VGSPDEAMTLSLSGASPPVACAVLEPSVVGQSYP
jgi:hypothetical protein